MRLGHMKDLGLLQGTWTDLAFLMNEESGMRDSESSWRKRYRRMLKEGWPIPAVYDDEDEDDEEDKDEEDRELEGADTDGDSAVSPLTGYFDMLEKQRVRMRDERAARSRQIRNEARFDTIAEIFSREIKAYAPSKDVWDQPDAKHDLVDNCAVYAMLSDVHYGIAFNSIGGVYNTEVAADRLHAYAEAIKDIGRQSHALTCYVSLMGDMISGNIHTGIRVENQENVIRQVIGISELTAAFLKSLTKVFRHVVVNSVSGNHSRVDLNPDDGLRADRLDALVPWYCKAKLVNLPVTFVDNALDDTIGSFEIFGKTYACIHGDFDKDPRKAVTRIENLLYSKQMKGHLDYMLVGHMHTPGMEGGPTTIIRNGSVCGSGDEYTMKKRLFGPPCQVCMVVDAGGIRSIHPVDLT